MQDLRVVSRVPVYTFVAREALARKVQVGETTFNAFQPEALTIEPKDIGASLLRATGSRYLVDMLGSKVINKAEEGLFPLADLFRVDDANKKLKETSMDERARAVFKRALEIADSETPKADPYHSLDTTVLLRAYLELEGQNDPFFVSNGLTLEKVEGFIDGVKRAKEAEARAREEERIREEEKTRAAEKVAKKPAAK